VFKKGEEIVNLKTEKKLQNIFLKMISSFVIISFIFSMQSCVQSSSNARRAVLNNAQNTNAPKTPAKLPEFIEGNSYIQNGGMIFTSSVNFDLSFTDTLQLRGKDVDNYIRQNGTQVITCLTGRFSASTVNQINVTAAMPHSLYNFVTQTTEYYYALAPSDQTNNKNFCQKPAVINKLFELYPTLTPTYKMSDLCTSITCVNSTFSSSPLEIYSMSGSPITQILTKQLTYTITNKPNISVPIGKTCISNSECLTIGYDCCSLGQCVKDLALKPGIILTSNDYVQALQDILNNPNHIYLYPQYYFICSNLVNNPTNPNTPGNPTSSANARLRKLQDLYNCTNKIEGEMGFCTTTIQNAIIGKEYGPEIEDRRDDRSFNTTYTNSSTSTYAPTAKEDLISIQEISYGEVTLFNYDQMTSEALARPETFTVSSYLTIKGHHNDDTDTGAKIKITIKPPTAVNNDLVIKYKTDASCTPLNTTLAKCEKYYIQGQQMSGDTVALARRGRVTDHFPASNIFKLPTYADTNKTITVMVDGITMRQDLDWQLNATAPSSIQFISSTGGLKVFDTQKVKITFFVDLSVNHVMDSKLKALEQIKETCHCADLNCGLRPVNNSDGKLVDFACIYPDPNPLPPPSTQIAYLSSKNVPVRFFDQTGVSKASLTGDVLPQEGRIFSYRKDNLLNPNNMPDIITPVASVDNYYIGFNEIYGSLNYSSNSAKPAKEVSVVRGKTYDIYVDNGAYSNCVLCGNDYYSQLNKLFPMAQFGGGLVPLQSTTSRTQTNGVRGDDMSFGRACFVPATMLPWSHGLSSDPQTQRLNRMYAQHFYYANGYQRDWYGFDYGAVIGSFDGVKWFAIGTNRRIKADSTKLFLAVNGPFGDLAIESTYTVTINDGSLNPIGSNMITSDLESDGAQCQKFHQCNSDNDCAATLGWDYICSSVNETTTSWPSFDENAKEIPDTMNPNDRLTSILGLSSVGKRCVYRGRGAACTQNYKESVIQTASDSGAIFNRAVSQSQHTCSSNNYCQLISTSGVLSSKFNNRIARFGKVRTDPTSDSFGLGAKVPGRPMEFNAEEQIRSETQKNLGSNRVAAICIPGRDPEQTTFINQNTTAPLAASDFNGDKILGIGMTYKKDEANGVSTYLAACAVTDSTNNYFYAKGTTPNAANSANAELIRNSGTQAISTNALYKFKSIFETTKNIKFPIYSNNTQKIDSLLFTENRCMRAPGASCFADVECAPSKAIADKIKMISAEDATLTAILNKHEIRFWQEELVCSQATPKNDSTYSPINNRCCREVGKTISIASEDTTIPLLNTLVPGIDSVPVSNINVLSSSLRYSRVATVYKDQKTDPANFPQLSVAIANECGAAGLTCKSMILNQYKTFSAYAERTSCSGDWIRNFSNGNHLWSKDRFQSFNTAAFQCMNWLPGNNNFSCAGLEQDDPNCRLIQTSPYSGKAKAIMNYMARLELTGIPQIALESQEFFNTATEGDLSCRSFPSNQNACYPGHPDPTTCTNNVTVAPQNNIGANAANYAYPSQLFTTGAIAEYKDSSNKKLYSASDELNFQSMKKIFKADEVASCLPAGTVMPVGADVNLCCTGFINGKTNKCQLPDFVDVSIYTNRYVSSEAKKLNPTLFDAYGYIKDPSYVQQLACEKSMCASGTLVFGVLVSNLKIPGQEAKDVKLFRFLEGSVASDNANGVLNLFNQGLKLNTHAYCFPAGVNTGGSDDLRIITCGN
jgi:hypothetical protein